MAATSPRIVVTITLPEPGSTYAKAVAGSSRFDTKQIHNAGMSDRLIIVLTFIEIVLIFFADTGGRYIKVVVLGCG